MRSRLIDGEVVCRDERGLARFDVLRRRRNETVLYALTCSSWTAPTCAASRSRCARRTVIQNLLYGRYGEPLRVVALNVSEGCSRDVSEAMAHKVREIAEHEDYELTQGTLDFIDAHIGRVRQPTLPLW